jgi:HD-GYP domain-containing protein (c-di-GMP phosphodiesterase class II)
MNMIDYFRTWPLTNGEVVTFAKETDCQIKEIGAHVLGIETIHPLYSELTCKLEQTYQVAAGNPVTAEKEKTEYYRDNRYGAFVAFVRNALYDSNQTIVTAAESIMDIVNGIGNPTNLGDSKATAELHSLVARLTPLSSQITIIGAGIRLQELEAANSEFERLQNEWYKAGAKKLPGNLSVVRKQWAPVYKSIIYRINALIEINSIEAYKAFTDAHNKTIAYYRNILAQRKGFRKANKADATEKRVNK